MYICTVERLSYFIETLIKDCMRSGTQISKVKLYHILACSLLPPANDLCCKQLQFEQTITNAISSNSVMKIADYSATDGKSGTKC
jgi:hypothetical protein